MTTIALAGLHKHYGDIAALSDVTGDITGRVIGLLGPNGAGKSTLLKCLLGLIPYRGSARVFDLEARDHGEQIRDRVGYMPEQESFIAGASAVELCAYAGELSGLPRSEAMQRSHAALYYAGVDDKRYQAVDTYSTGLKQRTKLAQALVHDPELLFLDEPTNGLDPAAREEMLGLIEELPERRGCAIVLSTHLLPDVERVCDRVVIMHRGAIAFSGPLAALRSEAPTELAVEVKSGAERLAEALRAGGATCAVSSPIALEVALPRDAPTTVVFEAARSVDVQLRALAPRRESLETAFLRVIGGDAVGGRSSAGR